MPDEPTRKGKIARLPAKIREDVNRRLFDGEPGPKIIAWLHTLPEVLTVLDEHFGEEPISSQNLSEWRGGGYQDWIGRRERIENLKQLSDYAFHLAKAAGGTISDGAAAIAGGKLLEFLENSDATSVEGLAIALAKLRDADSKLIRAQVSVRNADQKDEQLALEKAKFERTTASLFIKWYNDQRVREIMDSRADQGAKMDQLILTIFGSPPTS